MVTWRLYVEGGGNDNETLRTACREGFSRLLAKAGFAGRMPRIVAAGGRQNAFNLFTTAVRNRKEEEIVVLLVDSETARDTAKPKWKHLKDRDRWERPAGAAENDVFLMVQVMETWLLTDKEVWERYFGQGFNASALPTRVNLEEEPKSEVYAKIKAATRDTKTKGVYDKGAHSFELLGLVDPDKVKSLFHGRDFLDTLDGRIPTPPPGAGRGRR